MDVAMNANAVEAEKRLGRAIMSSSHGFWSLGGFIGGGYRQHVGYDLGVSFRIVGQGGYHILPIVSKIVVKLGIYPNKHGAHSG
jgi:hypothetical protein